MTAAAGDWPGAVCVFRSLAMVGSISDQRIWMYRFDYPEPQDNHRLGACHGAEIPFVFDTITLDEVHPRLGEAPSQAVADQVHRVWVDFITRGDPGWAAYNTRRRTTALLAGEINAADDPAGDERALWDGIR